MGRKENKTLAKYEKDSKLHYSIDVCFSMKSWAFNVVKKSDFGSILKFISIRSRNSYRNIYNMLETLNSLFFYELENLSGFFSERQPIIIIINIIM